MDIEKAKKLVRGLVFNDDGTMVNYIDFTSADYDSWNGYTLKEYAEAIETLLTAYEKEKGENVKLRLQDIPLIEGELKAYKDRVNELKAELEKEKEKNKEYNMGIKNLISQIESAIDFMKTDKSKIKVDMYKQKEEDLKLEIVHLKKILKEE